MTSMDVDGSPLPHNISPHNFPAKLWRLVNNPENKGIFWDVDGETIVIDRRLFESEILSPSTVASDNADAFKTTNFSSFVRQLNLYGFRKTELANEDNEPPTGDIGAYRYFCNPNFKRNHPELVASLRRLTPNNKAKIEAGLTVRCRGPSRYQRLSGADDDTDNYVKRGRASLLSPTRQVSTCPYYSNNAQAMTAHNGTPVPPPYLIRSHGTVLSPTVFTTDRPIPLSLGHHYAGVAPSSRAVHSEQGLVAHSSHGNPNFATFNPPEPQYQPLCFSPVCHFCQPNLVASHLTGFQEGLISPHSYFQARYAENVLGSGDHIQDTQKEVEKCDTNGDTIFQTLDEVIQMPTNSVTNRSATRKNPDPVSMPSNTCTTMPQDNPASPIQADPLCYNVPITVAVSGNADVVPYKQEEAW